MEYRENPMFGRRVFFLNPPMSIENYVIENLKAADYEVYLISDFTKAKAVLRRYENAICFIFIDDVLTQDGWYNFIKSFEYDESLKTIFLGVLSVRTKPKDQERFLMSLKLPGGFVMLDKKVEEIYQQLEGILKINGARGVRKCIRLDLKDSKDVNGYFGSGTQLYSFRLIDLSTLGFAATTPARMANVFKKGAVISNISITMGRYSFICTAVVYNVKIVQNTCIVVMLLSNETPKEIRDKIHNFVYECLERQHRIIMETAIRDMTDYNVRQRLPDEPESADSENNKSEKSSETADSTAKTEKNAENETESTESTESIESIAGDLEEVPEAEEVKTDENSAGESEETSEMNPEEKTDVSSDSESSGKEAETSESTDKS